MVLVGNKVDLPRAISSKEGKKLGAKYKSKYFETSAKTGQGVDDAVQSLVEEVYRDTLKRLTSTDGSIKLVGGGGVGKKKSEK